LQSLAKMWMKLGLVSFLAVSLLPRSTLSQVLHCVTGSSGSFGDCTSFLEENNITGFCGVCTPSCSINLGNSQRSLTYYNGSLYYFATDSVNNKPISWVQAEAACTSMFSAPAWFGLPGHLTSLQSQEEYDFIKSTLDVYSTRFSYIGGKKVGSDWTWTDGTPMNKILVDGLWKKNAPSVGSTAMEIVAKFGLNALKDGFVYGTRSSYVCKIPCILYGDIGE